MLKRIFFLLRQAKSAFGRKSQINDKDEINFRLDRSCFQTVFNLCNVHLGCEKYANECSERIFERIDREAMIFECRDQFNFYLKHLISEEVLKAFKELCIIKGELPPESWFALHPELWAGEDHRPEKDRQIARMICEN
jgi:hypothetical protein